MEALKDPNDVFNLEKSLSPLWKMTYYMGLMFDWCRRIPNQSRLVNCFRSLIIFFSFVVLLYSLSFSFFGLAHFIVDPTTKFSSIVLLVLISFEMPLIIYVWFHFLYNKTTIQAFFSDWKRIEEHNQKGVNSSKMKRTCIIIYTLYFSYGIYHLISKTVGPLSSPIGPYDDLIAIYYPSLIVNPFYALWIKIRVPLCVLYYVLFLPFVDIVPSMVYYHSANVIEGYKMRTKRTEH